MAKLYATTIVNTDENAQMQGIEMRGMFHTFEEAYSFGLQSGKPFSVCDYAYLKTTTTNTLPTETAATTETITVETAVEETSGCAV